jgi:murein DD-endopeptidase MepM/ murein hydrolase activator NlpD
VVRHGDGRYATYAHLQKGSVTVEVGDRVRPGQTLGKLGNTGNTSAPHLHLQITDRRSVLGSSGLPFVVDRFKLQGQVDPQRLATATTLEGTWNEGLSRARAHATVRFRSTSTSSTSETRTDRLTVGSDAPPLTRRRRRSRRALPPPVSATLPLCG